MVFNSVIVRFSGEIAIKSRGVRTYWENLLVDRIRRVCEGELIREGLRVYIKTEKPMETISRLKYIFGLSSFSPAIMVDPIYEEIEDAAFRIVDYTLQEDDSITTFGIFVEKNLRDDIDSNELKVKLGDEIRKKYNLKVKLKGTHLPICIEIREKKAFLFTERIPGPGGLPLGTQDKLVSMFSGGPDSSLASWYAMRRGSKIVLVYLDFGGEPLRSEALERALKGAERLSLWGGVEKLYIIDFDQVIRDMREKAPDKVIYLLFKRYMMRVAKIVAKYEGASGIVTGEIIGEQASQTVRNLAIITEAAGNDLPVFRPLISFDKDEVLRKLKDIDNELYLIAAKSIEPCKTLTVKPKMNLTLNAIQTYEKRIGIGESTLKKLVKNAEIIYY